MNIETTETIETRAKRLVEREVYVCLSSLVSTLASASGMTQSTINASPEAWELFNAAVELTAPVPDYEEAAIQAAGWAIYGEGERAFFGIKQADGSFNTSHIRAPDWQGLCDDLGIDPIDREVYEHWAVSAHLAADLAELGEKVDTDFAGMCVWARTTTGQAIYADSVIKAVVRLIDKRAATL